MKEITNPPPYQHFGSEPEYLGGASPDRRVTTEKKNQKALKTQCFQGFFVVRVKGLVVSEASVIAERANLFAEVIVYAQRFVASNNATHSCDKSHNRWLCPLRSISANASTCFSLCLRSAAQRAGANKRSAVCQQNVVLFQVRCRMKKDNPFGLSFFGADNRTCSE